MCIRDRYNSSNISLPETASISYEINSQIPAVSVLLNYEMRFDLNQSILHGTLQMKANEKLDLYLSTHSDRSDLFYGDYIQQLTAGISIGFGYYSNTNLFNMAIQDLGAAGYSTSFSFSKIIL